ncbi:type IV pilus twitching motility protein PilT [Desulfitibacter alkalitolerans]|uniref:type IV pilus twitching motility protein PilT n=1 Tax=Desulfitibacter alkalitolerans TaxID=264641 RepID=UPI00054E4BFF|nr:type IV pilus twitching motility protein PilT [Desulfitibacter alkalitolerans]
MTSEFERVYKDKYPVNIDKLLETTCKNSGSDLHLAVGIPPMARIKGKLVPLEFPVLSVKAVEELVMAVVQPEYKRYFEENLELDLSYSLPGIARFRGNIMKQRGTLAAVFRIVPFDVPDINILGLPPAVKDLCFLSRGLVLVTGPTGSGKSTTLAAMVDLINSERRVNIVTIEDPIEFLHKHKNSVVKQREVGLDTRSFANALKHVLRHDPDVILVGEMRDVESIAIALTAAETGHLVFSTLHTQTAPHTINRIVDVFQDYKRDQVRQQLANTLRGVISQQLIPTADGKGRVVAVEFMKDTPAIRNMIREGKEHQLYSAIQTNRNMGMQTMDQALANLYAKGKIKKEVALEYCIDRVEIERIMQRVESNSSYFWNN